LINTRLVPGLEERDFEVLPIGRVSGDILKYDQCDNIFVFNLFTHLEQSKTAPERFARLRLADFLANLALEGNNFVYAAPSAQPPVSDPQAEIDIAAIRPRVLIIDQFEELVTTHPEAWEKRADLFAQIAEAMQQDPYLWVVLVMREDYVATFDPFAHLLPNQLRARFYMRRMESSAALDAVRRPVEKLRPFDTGIAETLVDNLRIVTGTQSQGIELSPVYGEFIEPVQLQVVCYQLWSSLMQESDTLAPGKRITQKDIDALAKGESLAQFINKALGDFYEQALQKVLEKLPGKVSERDLRSWFSNQLITEAETRGFVYQGKTQTEGLPNAAVDLLASYYIIRPETRPGGIWFELVHDRFVGPILQSNRDWLALHQSRLLTDAMRWNELARPAELLYESRQLETAEAEIQSRGSAISELEKQFVAAAAQLVKRKRAFRLQIITLGIIALFVVLSGLSWWALSGQRSAVVALSTAKVANENAVLALRAAETAKNDALQSQATVLAQNADLQAQSTMVAQGLVNQYESVSRLQTQYAPYLNASLSTPEPTNIDATSTLDPASAPDQTQTIEPTPTIETAERTLVIGKSARGQDITAYQYGIGARHIVFVGGLQAGYSPSTVKIAQLMIDYLHRNPQRIPSAITVDIILNANPDSLTNRDQTSEVKGRFNGNGVELNTNWDCNWKQNATWSTSLIPVNGGSAPFSEPETRALKDFILGNLSSAVIVWQAHATAGNSVSPGGCGEKSIFSQPLSDMYARQAGYTPIQYIPYNSTGAMADWLDTQSIPSIYVYLPDLKEASRLDLDAQIQGLNAIIQSFTK
jgi:hypothetical protein